MNFSEFLWLDSSEFYYWMCRRLACDEAIERFRGLSAAQAFLCLSPDTNDWELIRWVANIVKSKHLRYLMSVYDTDLAHLTSKRSAYADVLVELENYRQADFVSRAVWRLYHEARDRVTEVLREALTAIRDWAISRGDTPFLEGYKDQCRFVWEVPLTTEIYEDENGPHPYSEPSRYDGGGVPASEGGGAYAGAVRRLDPETLIGYWTIPELLIMLSSDGIGNRPIAVQDREALAREAQHLASQDYGSDENTNHREHFFINADDGSVFCRYCGLTLESFAENSERPCAG